LTTEDENEVLIAKKGGIDLILTAMKLHPNHASVQKSGCSALHNLALKGELIF
jgi:hypothetical protein